MTKGESNTKNIWFYDLRTNSNFTLVENTLSYKDLEDFIKCYHSEDRTKRKETERFKKYTYEEVIKRDKLNLDIFWIKDKSLEAMENLPEPEVLAKDIINNLKTALSCFEKVSKELK